MYPIDFKQILDALDNNLLASSILFNNLVHEETDKVFFNEYRKIYNSHFLRISFKNFCDMIEANRLVKFDNNHPSYKMHKEWSKYLHKQLLTPEGYFGSD